MYSEKVMKEFKNPKNLGKIDNPDAVSEVGNPVCLTPETKIDTTKGLTEIKEIEKNDFVLNHKGKYSNVSKKFQREYKGKIVKIKSKLGINFVTPEHQIFAIKIPKNYRFFLHKNKKKLFPDWFHAEELEKGDIITYPILKEIKDKKYISFKQERKKWDFRSQKIPNKINVNNDFLKFAGYYLSEGNIKEKVGKTYLGLTFGSKEDFLAEDSIKIVKKSFGIKAKKKKREKRNTIVVEVNNVWLTRLFLKLFNKGAKNKKIPFEFMILPPKKQKSLIYGLWMGDGYFNTERPRAGYSTISYELCHQIKTLLLRQRIVPSIYTEKEKTVKGVNHQKSYRIHIGERKSLKILAKILRIPFKPKKTTITDSWFKSNYLCVPITAVNKVDYKGKVYNLEIKSKHSFTTESLSVHNCGDMLKVYLKIKDNKIEDIKVETFGCVSAIATSSKATEMVKGKTIEEALKLTEKQVADALDGLPPIKMHCSVLAVQAIKKAIEDYKNKQKKS